jgi:hypothetical protein
MRPPGDGSHITCGLLPSQQPRLDARVVPRTTLSCTPVFTTNRWIWYNTCMIVIIMIDETVPARRSKNRYLRLDLLCK